MIVLLVLPSIVVSQPELKGSPDELRGFLYPSDKIVTIRGQAEETAYSDKAILSLVITTENDQLSMAISRNGNLRNKISQELVKAGISKDNIKSSKFSSSPQYGWFGKKPSSYKVVNRMAISILKESHLKEVAVVADKYEEADLSNTTFEHTKKDEYTHQVKVKALDKIQKQKQFYEKSLGVKLTPIGIRDSNLFQRATPGAMMLDQVVVSAAQEVRREQESYSSVSKYKPQPNRSSFDEVKYEANLSIDYKIE